VVDKRILWHSGQAHSPVDLATVKDWPVVQMKHESLVKLDVDEPIPYLTEKGVQRNQRTRSQMQ
jgi:hypothetical protein